MNNDVNNSQQNGQAVPIYPKFKCGVKTFVLPIVIAIIAWYIVFMIVFSMSGMDALSNEDEAGTIKAFAVSSGIGGAVAIAVGILSFIILKKRAWAKYIEQCKIIKEDFAKAQAEEQARIAAEERRKKAEEEMRKLYKECEFCGGELEYHDIKGYTHNGSYQDGYKVEVKTSTDGIIRPNRVSYFISTGTESYRCPCCHYYMRVQYERFNGQIRSNTGIDIFGKDEDMKVSREDIKKGRLYTSFKIVKSQIPY